jgi:hypothetical protein
MSAAVSSPPRVVVTRGMVGVCHMQVCAVADATDEEILAICNRENPAGTSGGWSTVHRSSRPGSVFGNEGPVACADDSARTHFLVSC